MSKPEMTILENGLAVITQHVPGEQVYTNVTVNVGFRHERPDQDNMAHFLEHMAAGENELLNTQEREAYIQNRRGSMNATTSMERTDYWLQFGKEHAEDAVKLLADGFLRPKFDDKNVDVEREAVETELRGRVDDAPLINYQRVHQTAFPDSQLDKDWFETVETVKNHTTEQLKDFKAIHYTADNMALAVVGDIKHEDAVAWAREHFAGLKSSPDVEREPHPPAVYRGGMKTYTNAEASEVNFCIGFEGASRKDPTNAAIDQIIAGILGSGSSSRLHKSMVQDKEIAHDVGAYPCSYVDNSVFMIDASTTGDALAEAVGALAEESKKLASTLTQEEVDKVKNALTGGAERSVEDISNIGQELAFTKAIDGKLYDVEEDLAILNNITLEQVQERAAQLFTSPPSISVHGDDLSQMPSYEEISGKFGQSRVLGEDGLVVQTEQEKAAAIERANAAPIPPVLPETTATPQQQPETTVIEASKPQVTVLDNGLKIITQKMPTKQINAELRVGAGNRHESYDQTSIADVVRKTCNAASERLNISERSETVANMRGTNGSAAAQESTSFKIRAANEFTNDALQVLAENVTSPKFDDDSIAKQQTMVKKVFLSEKLDSQTNTAGQIRRVAFPGSQMDKNPLDTSAEVETLSKDDIKAFKDQHYTADNMVLSVVGDVDHDAIVEQAKAQFADLKATPDQPREPLPQAKYRGGMEVITSNESDQVTLRIGFEGKDNSDPKTNATDNVLASILGGGFSSRLMSSLRTDKGLVYYASAVTTPMSDSGLFTIVTGTHQDKLDNVVDAIAEEVCRIADTVTQEELDAVKNDKAGDLERAAASPSALGSILSDRLSRGKVFDVHETVQNYKDVTLEDIKARANEIFASAPSVAAYGKGADRLPSYEEISEKFGKRRELDASGLVVDNAPDSQRSIQGANISGLPQEKERGVG